MFDSTWCLIMTQIQFSLIKNKIERPEHFLPFPLLHPITSHCCCHPPSPLIVCIFSVILSICCCHLVVYYLTKHLWNYVRILLPVFVIVSMTQYIENFNHQFHMTVFVGAVSQFSLALWSYILEPAEVLYVIFPL